MKMAKNRHFDVIFGPSCPQKIILQLKIAPKDSRYTIISFKASKKIDITIIGRLLAARNSILGHFLIKKISFSQHLDPLVRQKMCDENTETPKTESSDTNPSNMLYTPSPL